jgi:hypothetical protein
MAKKNTSLLTIALYMGMAITSSSCSYAINPDSSHNVIKVGSITASKIDEASGVAVSRISDDLLWINNDSGNSASLYAVNSNGDHLVTLNIKKASNNDWEDVASFIYQGKSYLLIADTGDNSESRKSYRLHIVEEPMISHQVNQPKLTRKPSWSIEFTYPDGPHDCEAVAVDIVQQKILLLTKRNWPPVLYELPLTAKGKVVAKKLGEIPELPKPAQSDIRLVKYFNYANQPTGLDISADGLSAVVLTYSDAYYFSVKQQPTNWLTVLSSRPIEVPVPYLTQAEAIGFNQNASSIFVTTEKLPAPLINIAVPREHR